MAKKKSSSKKTPAFEVSLESLNEVVQQLEDGSLSLSDSLDQYEQGVKHLKNCHQALKSAQRRIELLVKLDEDGNLVTSDFDDSATEDVKTGTRRTAKPRKKKAAAKSGRTAEQQELVDELEEETDDSATLFD